jgi:hypothetical protein
MIADRRRLALFLLLGTFVSITANVSAADRDELELMLHEFLAGAETAAAHQKFWADDLVYTSSSGTRTTKAAIMAGFANAAAGENDASGPLYTAEDIDIRVIGTTAIVAFRLVATDADQAIENYLNTGTFLKRNGRWQVAAWQATRAQRENTD